MSHHLVNLAWETDLPHSQKVVLLALSHLAVQSTGMCSPSVRLLSHMCGLSHSGARSNLKLLAAKGLVDLIPLDGENGYRVKVGGKA
ncbi:helix-turn-helix protein [Paraburkholderia sp. BL8N3]|nr:helix-turn-helix domain-containing protein [Paraburkholderia sp. BL8N3]TCK44009.1 helix-turn-helix protein [Paraburkholderia sp. BL8N3]